MADGGEDEKAGDPTPKGNQPAVIDSDADRIRVNAGAGTGKTSTMVWKIQRQVEQQGANPGRVLALTFANKAATNIEARVADQLDATAGYNVSAFTYHSFCHRLLQDYAYYTDHPPDFELVTERTNTSLLREVVQRTDFELIEPMTPGGNGTRDDVLEGVLQFIGTLKPDGHTPADVRAILPEQRAVIRAHRAVEELRRAAEPLHDFDALFDDFDDTDRLLLQGLFRYLETLERFAEEFAGEGPFLDDIADYLDEMGDAVERVQAAISQAGDYHDLTFVPTSLFGPYVHDRVHGNVEQNLFVRLREYVDCYRRAHDYTDAYAAYERGLDERDALDYDDLIQGAHDLLTDDQVGPEIRAQWDYVYCDEFQDTHRSELAVVEALAADADLLVIGDTDQAIYEWRGTDPRNLADISDVFPDIEAIDLDLNFRSFQGILDLTGGLGHTDELTAHRGRGENEVVKVEGYPDRTAQAEQVATAVAHLIQGRFDDVGRYDKGDIAVVVRKNAHARAVADQLEAESIPYSVSSTDDGEQSPGVETVLSYLRFLVDDTDETNLSRVLLHLYGLPQADIRRLHDHDAGLAEALTQLDTAAFEAPEKVERARGDIEYLREAAAVHSLTGFYERFKDRTRIEWYLTEDERRDLAQLENKIEGYGEEGLDDGLTAEFVSHLDLQETISRETMEGRIEAAETADDEVNLLTVHKAKGLDFEVVLVPFLSDEEWLSTPGNYARTTLRYGALEGAIEGSGTDWLRADCSDTAEEWRTLHVAITRAKDHVFLFGNRDEPGEDVRPLGEVEQFLPDSIEWSLGGERMDVWEAVTDSYDRLADRAPQSTLDLTDEIEAGAAETKENISYWGTQIDPGAAESTVLSFARQLRAGDLDAVDPAAFDLRAAPGRADVDAGLVREHSHSSLETFTACPRRHYLDHVVEAFDDPQERGHATRAASDPTAVDRAAVGTLFHDVAEEAYWRDYTTQAEWREATAHLGRRRDLPSEGIDLAQAAVDRYFETPVPSWTQEAAEWPFVVEDYLPDLGGVVKGFVDGIYRRPDGDLVVLDYKTTRGKKDIAESYQLLLYLEALDERLDDEPVTTAGYAYVGEAGPEVDLYDAEDLGAYRDDLHEALRAADDSSFADPRSGEICADCVHHSLGCADPRWDAIDGALD